MWFDYLCFLFIWFYNIALMLLTVMRTMKINSNSLASIWSRQRCTIISPFFIDCLATHPPPLNLAPKVGASLAKSTIKWPHSEPLDMFVFWSLHHYLIWDLIYLLVSYGFTQLLFSCVNFSLIQDWTPYGCLNI
jgi:hypothetical protein